MGVDVYDSWSQYSLNSEYFMVLWPERFTRLLLITQKATYIIRSRQTFV